MPGSGLSSLLTLNYMIFLVPLCKEGIFFFCFTNEKVSSEESGNF